MGDNLNGIFANMIQGMGFIGCAPNRVYNMAPPNGGGVEATAEGTELTLHSAAAPLTGLTLYGRSEQETTTGAQLLDFASEAGADSTQNGVTITNNRNGSFTVTGTPTVTEGYVFTFFLARNVTLSDGTYRANTGVRIRRKDGTVGYANTFFTFNSETDEAIDLYYQKSVQNYVDGETIWPMLNSGTTVLPWEPYTGGAPSPSPDYPQEIKSIGDSGTVNVSLSDGGSQSQTLQAQTPGGLPGIPVSSGGNYTDADGQEWICDEVDFKREVYVQRIGTHLITKVTKNILNSRQKNPDFFGCENELRPSGIGYDKSFMSDKLLFAGINKNIDGAELTIAPNNGIMVFGLKKSVVSEATAEAVTNYLSENPIKVLYALATPIETPLSPSDIAAYSALRTYSPTTVVTNDAGAWMKVGYKATPQPMTMLARKR